MSVRIAPYSMDSMNFVNYRPVVRLQEL
ncbi:hypothetical protein BLA29_013821 [Euroglyphus maynei]|uniref:Uncharacterized protein n=1 Tax=Euroglyphus maynei TaxID=6958 RepID=A0A1Y3B3B3_EURMA|nr:hypothetical protein BLA29_013821 [Euroglyphus maynei]